MEMLRGPDHMAIRSVLIVEAFPVFRQLGVGGYFPCANAWPAMFIGTV